MHNMLLNQHLDLRLKWSEYIWETVYFLSFKMVVRPKMYIVIVFSHSYLKNIYILKNILTVFFHVINISEVAILRFLKIILIALLFSSWFLIALQCEMHFFSQANIPRSLSINMKPWKWHAQYLLKNAIKSFQKEFCMSQCRTRVNYFMTTTLISVH